MDRLRLRLHRVVPWTVAVAVIGSVTALALAIAPSSAAEEPSGGITGTVSWPTGIIHPDAQPIVSASRSDGPFFHREVPVGSSGSYSIPGLEAGDYVVAFSEEANIYGIQHFGAASSEAATPITVGSSTISEIDFEAQYSNGISGTVTDATGASLHLPQQLTVGFQDELGNALAAAPVQQDGSYLVGGLTAGRYRVKVNDSSNWYLEEWFHGSATGEGATLVEVSDGQQVGNIDIELDLSPAPDGARETALNPQQVTKVPVKVRAGKSKSLRKRTDAGVKVKWKSKKSRVCQVRKAKVYGVKTGKCRLKSVAKSKRGYARYKDIHTLRVR